MRNQRGSYGLLRVRIISIGILLCLCGSEELRKQLINEINWFYRENLFYEEIFA